MTNPFQLHEQQEQRAKSGDAPLENQPPNNLFGRLLMDISQADAYFKCRYLSEVNARMSQAERENLARKCFDEFRLLLIGPDMDRLSAMKHEDWNGELRRQGLRKSRAQAKHEPSRER